MKASELIKKLEKMIVSHGDIEVNRHNQDSTYASMPFAVEEVEVAEVDVDPFNEKHYLGDKEPVFKVEKIILIK